MSLDRSTGLLWVNGVRFELTPTETWVVAELLDGNVVSPYDYTRGHVRDHIKRIRKKTPLNIRNLYARGYVLDMTDAPDKTTDAVRDATMGARRALQERFPGSERGDIVFDKNTGVGTTQHEVEGATIETVVRPKEKPGA